MEDPRAVVAPVLAAFADAMQGRALGLSVSGSLAAGDYRPPAGDIDAVALVETRLRASDRAALVSMHERLVESHDRGRALHCVSVSRGDVLDVERRHWTWGCRPRPRLPRARDRAPLVTCRGAPSDAPVAEAGEYR